MANARYQQYHFPHTPQLGPPIPQIEAPKTTQTGLRQLTLDQFVTNNPTNNTPTPIAPTQTTQKQGTSSKERGFPFCNTTLCRYCKILNKTGTIVSQKTKTSYTCMKNISCRSSNLIYCLTCQNCGKQYVGQTLRRLKDRLYEHLRDIDTLNPEKPLGVHFAQTCKENPSIKAHVLEFIKKPPRSPEALTIRNRVEKRWIHLLRTPAPHGLNLED